MEAFLQTSEFYDATFNLSPKELVYNLFRTRSLRKNRFQEQQRPLPSPKRAMNSVGRSITRISTTRIKNSFVKSANSKTQIKPNRYTPWAARSTCTKNTSLYVVLVTFELTNLWFSSFFAQNDPIWDRPTLFIARFGEGRGLCCSWNLLFRREHVPKRSRKNTNEIKTFYFDTLLGSF